MFGPAAGVGVQLSFEALCAEAGLTLLVPEQIESMCCGTPWSSKGIPDGGWTAAMGDTVLPVIREATDNGRLYRWSAMHRAAPRAACVPSAASARSRPCLTPLS